MMTPAAPAFCASITLLLYRHVPRWINAMAPARDPAGRAEQANPSFCNWATSRSGAGGGDTWGPSPNRAGMFCRLGLVEERRPVAVPTWLKVVCTRPSESTSEGSESR